MVAWVPQALLLRRIGGKRKKEPRSPAKLWMRVAGLRLLLSFYLTGDARFEFLPSLAPENA